jgi:hypothetical protein
MPTLSTALATLDRAHADTAESIQRLRQLCADLRDVASNGQRCLAESRELLKSVNEQLRPRVGG